MTTLEKNWKKKLTVATAAAALAALPMIDMNQAAPEQHVEKKKARDLKEFMEPFGMNSQDRFLEAISELESSAGKNTKHKAMHTGLHQGDKAIGDFGIMPKTFRNVANSLRLKDSKLRSVLGDSYRDDEFDYVSKLPDRALKETLKSRPDLQLRAARYLATHLDVMHNGDPAKKAHGWRFGSNRPSDQITPRALIGSGYVQKFLQNYNAVPPAPGTDLETEPTAEVPEKK